MDFNYICTRIQMHMYQQRIKILALYSSPTRMIPETLIPERRRDFHIYPVSYWMTLPHIMMTPPHNTMLQFKPRMLFKTWVVFGEVFTWKYKSKGSSKSGLDRGVTYMETRSRKFQQKWS